MSSCEKAIISFQSHASKARKLESLVDSVAALPLLSPMLLQLSILWILDFCMSSHSRCYKSSNTLTSDDELSSLLRILDIWGRGSVCPFMAPESLWLLYPVPTHHPLTCSLLCSWYSPFCLLLNKLSIF